MADITDLLISISRVHKVSDPRWFDAVAYGHEVDKTRKIANALYDSGCRDQTVMIWRNAS